MTKKTFQLLLASRSPRRRSILKEAGFLSRSISSNSSESFNENLTIDQNLKAIARDKVQAVANKLSPRKRKEFLILGADTVVVVGKTVLGKPKNSSDARRMIGLLEGKRHHVKTAFCIYCPSEEAWIMRVVTTKVGFRRLSKDEVQWYVSTKEPFDKAGAYAIQGLAQHFVNFINGDFLNVVGLPLDAIEKEIGKHNWSLKKRSRKNRSG